MKKIIYKFISKFFLDGCSEFNTLEVRRSCRSKQQARKAFKKLNIPYAKGDIFINPFKSLSFIKKNNFPVVIKPNVGGFSRGAYFPINNKIQLLKASFAVKKWWLSSIVEEYLNGNNYRIVVIKDEIMTIAKRFPPFIIGDGKQNISDLINEENNKREEKKLLSVLKKIPQTNKIKKYLKTQNKTFLYIPKDREKIYLHNKIALNLGGSLETIDNKNISIYNKKQLLNIINYFDANILGIDVICEQELDIDFNKQKCIFLEVNSRPYLKMHEFSRYGLKEDLSTFLEKLNKVNAQDF